MEERDFKGVWIPRRLWLNKDLSITEKCLLVEIDSLDKNESGCFASNQYLAEFIGVKEGRCANIISDLKKRGYLKQVSFDGRNRRLKVCDKSESESRVHENVKAEFTKTLSQTSLKDEHSNTVRKTNKEDINNIPAEENKDNISLLTSDTVMYESKKDNIELNCTFPINDVTIQVEKPKKKSKSNFQSNPDKYTWINARVKEFNEGLPKDRQFARPNKSGKTREEKAGNTHILGVVYDKFGEEKATEFFNYIVAKGEWRNPYSISSLKNQEEFENFYQDPQEEQPKYLGVTKWDSYKRFQNELEEPSVGSFYNEDSFYAALEYYYSTTLSGTELVKKVRERVKEINCKYNKY